MASIEQSLTDIKSVASLSESSKSNYDQDLKTYYDVKPQPGDKDGDVDPAHLRDAIAMAVPELTLTRPSDPLGNTKDAKDESQQQR